MPGNAVLVNFSGGETSPRSRGRFDAPWYQTAARKLVNWIAELTGSARYRPGFQFAWQTRGGAVPRILPFQVNNSLAYVLEFTPGFMRAALASTQQLITTTSQSLTAVTKASPGAFTVSSATGLVNDQEVIVSAVVGMTQLNGRQLKIANLSGTTFNLKDAVTGVLLDTTSFTTYVSGGTVAVIYEIATTYAAAADLANLQIASTRSLAYLTCGTQPAQKLTVDSTNAFTIGSYSRTNDPFTSTVSLNIIDIIPGAIFDDFANGLGLWTSPTLMTTLAMTGSYRATSSDGNRTALGYTSSSMYAAQTAHSGTWAFDLIQSHNGNSVADSTGTSFSGVVNAYARIIPIWADASNFYELRVYGSDMNTCRLYFNNAGVASLVGTFSGLVVAANTPSHFKLTRDGSGVWVLYQDGVNLGTFTENTLVTSVRSYIYMTAPIFTSGVGVTQIGIDNVYFPSTTHKTLVWTQAPQVAAAGVSYTVSGVVGATQINGNAYTLAADDGSTMALLKSAGADVDSSAWGAYVSGGVAAGATENPIGVAFYEGRLVFAGTDQRPDCLFLSRSPDSSGNSRYDDFTGGSNADFACFFQLAPTGGSTDYICWARGGPDYLFIGTFGGPYRISGSGLDIPITPNSINVRQFDDAGAAATMATGLAQMFFVQRAGVTVRAIKVINPYLATFESDDLCQNAEQIGYSALQRVVLQRGRPDALWTYRADGVICSMSVHVTVAASEAVTGWARHTLGGGGVCKDITITQRTTGLDQLWIATQRTVNGASRCYVEVMADDVYFPDKEDFFSGAANSTADETTWENILYRLSERYTHVDDALTYDGSARGTTAAATLTPRTVGGAAAAYNAATTYALGDAVSFGPTWTFTTPNGVLTVAFPAGTILPNNTTGLGSSHRGFGGGGVVISKIGALVVITFRGATTAAQVQTALRAYDASLALAQCSANIGDGADLGGNVDWSPTAYNGITTDSVPIPGAYSFLCLVAGAGNNVTGSGWYNVSTTATVPVGTFAYASQNVFAAADVGAYLWKKPSATTGVGAGKSAAISTYLTAKIVFCLGAVLTAFNVETAIAAGEWYFATTALAGLWMLDGESVAVVVDGAVYSDGGLTSDADYPTVTVSNGRVTLTDAAAVVHVGKPYVGLLETHNLDMGGRSGPAQAKPRLVTQMFLRFMNSLGCEYGTNPYRMTAISDRKANATNDRVAPVFSGIRMLDCQDTSSGLDDATQEKVVVVMQRKPLPAVLQSIDVHYDTTDEG